MVFFVKDPLSSEAQSERIESQVYSHINHICYNTLALKPMTSEYCMLTWFLSHLNIWQPNRGIKAKALEMSFSYVHKGNLVIGFYVGNQL